MDTPAAVFLVDLVETFGSVFRDGIDPDTLWGLALIAGRHLSESGAGDDRDVGILLDAPRCTALIKRLRLSGALCRDDTGRLAPGHARPRSRMAPKVRQAALDHVEDALLLFAEYEGMSELRFATAGGGC